MGIYIQCRYFWIICTYIYNHMHMCIIYTQYRSSTSSICRSHPCSLNSWNIQNPWQLKLKIWGTGPTNIPILIALGNLRLIVGVMGALLSSSLSGSDIPPLQTVNLPFTKSVKLPAVGHDEEEKTNDGSAYRNKKASFPQKPRPLPKSVYLAPYSTTKLVRISTVNCIMVSNPDYEKIIKDLRGC